MKYALASMMLLATAFVGGSSTVNNPPIFFDEFGVGTQGVPPGYGYGSAQGGYGSGYGGYGASGAGQYEYRYGRGNAAVGFGPGVGPTTGPFHYRPDLWLNDAKKMAEDADQSATTARSLHRDLATDLSRHAQVPQAIAAYNQGLGSALEPFAGGGGGGESLNDKARKIIRQHCAACHLDGNADDDVALDAYMLPENPPIQLQKDTVAAVKREDKPGARRMPKGRPALPQSSIDILEALLEQSQKSGTIPDTGTPADGANDPPATPTGGDTPAQNGGADSVADGRLQGIEDRLASVEEKLTSIDQRLNGPPATAPVAGGPRFYRIVKRR